MLLFAAVSCTLTLMRRYKSLSLLCVRPHTCGALKGWFGYTSHVLFEMICGCEQVLSSYHLAHALEELRVESFAIVLD